ncbi:Hypothetical protein CINCED_3A017124 [Cinara cedri]|uniref:Uncharacterized protein n=1 Tax=Cinara cedri TaxID=506608 RepID=A0A5E4NKV5_9HEMI|nr:Hypothetical protein CINCED_3A017124 [Cinara cedri]
MKIPGAFALLLSTHFVAYGATTAIIPDRHSLLDRHGDRTNNDAGLMSRGTSTSYDGNDNNGFGHIAEWPEYKNAETPADGNERSVDGGGNSYGDNVRPTDADQPVVGRSAESFGSDAGMASGTQDEIGNGNGGVGGPVPRGSSVIMRKIAALDAIVAEQYGRCNGAALLDLDDPLPVKKSTVKITKHNFVHFHGAELRDLKHGRLEYLSVNPAKDTVYVECAFENLRVNGTYTTNLPRNGGRFAVDADAVRSKVSASFRHRGRGPAVSAAVSATVTAEADAANDRDAAAAADAVNESLVAGKYRRVLEKAIAKQVYDSTYKGMVARLKAEMTTPAFAVADDDRLTGFRDFNWTDGDLSARMFNIGPRQSSLTRVQQTIDSVSYTRGRADRNAYELRFDVIVEGLKWTGDLTATLAGQPARALSVEFSVAKPTRIRFAVYKSSADGGGRPECRRVETDVEIDDLRYELPEKFPASVKSAVRSKLPGFVRQSLVACAENAFKREVCNDRTTNN